MENLIFALLTRLLDASPVDKEKAEKILAVKLEVVNSDEGRHFHSYKASRTKGPWRRFELQVPKSRGGVSMSFDMEEASPTRAEVLKAFGKPKYEEKKEGTQSTFSQAYQTQTLIWVINPDGKAVRVRVQDGR